MPLKKFIKENLARTVRENLALTTGILLPVAMVLLFVAVSTIPRLLTAPPTHKLLMLDSTNDSAEQVKVNVTIVTENGVLKANTFRDNKMPKGIQYPKPRLYILDAATGEKKELPYALPTTEKASFEITEAGKFSVDTSTLSPDGYNYEGRTYHSNLGLDFFGGSHRIGARLKKGAAVYMLDNATDNMSFVGWLTEKNSHEQ